MRKFQIGIVLFALAMLYTQRVSAMGASAGILVGNGFKDGYNVGFGARGGFTLPLGVYIGGTFVYHLGKSESTPGGDLTTHLFYFGPEGGYELSAGPLTVRPYLGLGYASFSASVPQSCSAGICGGGPTLTDSKLAVWPGATALFPVGNLFIGADLRYVVLLDTTDANAFSIFLTGGIAF
jgi:hypothetical protein